MHFLYFFCKCVKWVFLYIFSDDVYVFCPCFKVEFNSTVTSSASYNFSNFDTNRWIDLKIPTREDMRHGYCIGRKHTYNIWQSFYCFKLRIVDLRTIATLELVYSNKTQITFNKLYFLLFNFYFTEIFHILFLHKLT